jgi:hypothetical protein
MVITGFIWPRIGRGDWLVLTWLWVSGFHKIWGISWLTEEMLTTQEGPCFMQLANIEHSSFGAGEDIIKAVGYAPTV